VAVRITTAVGTESRFERRVASMSYTLAEWNRPTRCFEWLCGAGEGVCIGMQEVACFVDTDAEVLGRHYSNSHVNGETFGSKKRIMIDFTTCR
jgi:hypothetical protein